MALREEQILRYSRQILLREVGGRGQEKLLAGGVRLKAAGRRGADGRGVRGGRGHGGGGGPGAPGARAPRASSCRRGRWAGRARRCSRGSCRSSTRMHCPRAVPGGWRSCPRYGTARAPGWRWAATGRGARSSSGDGGCAGCFEATTAALGPPPSGALGVGLGALGALILQRLLLGLGPALGACGWEAPGVLTDLAVRRCVRCG